jgi:predicted nuclease of predicted toxin-antitoxin system
MKFLLDHDVPDELSFLLTHLGHDVTLLRQAIPVDSPDEKVLAFSFNHGCILLTCNRDDFLELARQFPHHGIIVVIRRRTRAAERAALLGLLERAGESGLVGNFNFA